MRAFVSGPTEASLGRIRAANAATAFVMLVLAAAQLRWPEGRRVQFYWLISSVPLALFLFTSSNPSAPAIAGTAAGFTALFAAIRVDSERNGWVASGIAAVSMATACLSRADAVYYCALALLTAALAAGAGPVRQPLRTALRIAPSALVIGLGLVLASRRELAADEMLAVDSGNPGANGVLATLPFVPLYYVGELAVTLGWLDTAMPTLVWVGGALALFLISLGLRFSDGARTLSIVVLGASMVAVPIFALQRSGSGSFYWVQPRYVLPMVFMAVALAALDPGALPRWRAMLIWLISVPVHAVALHTLMRRHLTGLDVDSWDLSRRAEWWWAIPVSPNLSWAITSSAFGLLALGLALRASPRGPRLVAGGPAAT